MEKKAIHMGKWVLKNSLGNLIFQFLEFYSEDLSRSYNIQCSEVLKNRITF